MNTPNLEISDEISLNTENGILTFRYASLDGKEALIVSNILESQIKVKLRIHSSCVFSETFHAIECDCSDQLDQALKNLSTDKGIIIYLFDEGRGVGLRNKIEAIKLQKEKGLNTAEAFKALGFQSDERSFELATAILKHLYSGKELDLITNNPLKIQKVKEAGLIVTNIENSIHAKNDLIKNYLIEKRDFLGHKIELEE